MLKYENVIVYCLTKMTGAIVAIAVDVKVVVGGGSSGKVNNNAADDNENDTEDDDEDDDNGMLIMSIESPQRKIALEN